MADIGVACSGALLSSLIFKLKNVKGDAEGFLYGEVRQRRIENITDSQSAGVKEELSIFIQNFVCCDYRFSFYNHLGQLHFARIEEILGAEVENVVGWFSYRRNTSHQISLRERTIHDRLMTSFPTIASKHFLFGLFTEQLLEKSEVHSTLYTFYNRIGTSLQLTKCEIVNLGKSVAAPYQHLPPTPLPPSPLPHTPSHISTIIQQHRHQFHDVTGQMLQTEAVEKLYTAIIAKLVPLRSELKDSATKVVALAKEVAALQKEVDNLKDEEDDEKLTSLDLQKTFDGLLKHKDNLIDLDGLETPTDVVPPVDKLQPQVTSSQDLLCNSPDPSNETQDRVLEPQILTCSDNHRTADSVVQSQELF